MNDFDLLQLYARDRSRDALEHLIRRHAGWVHGVALRRTRSAQLADDVVQEVFLALAERPPCLEDEAKVPAWIFGVTCRICARTIRGEVRLKRREGAFAMSRPESSNAGSDEAGRALEWDELATELDRAVQSLRREDRQAILLRYYQRKGHKDVAAALGISVDATRQRVSRALGELRRILTSRGIDAPPTGALSAALVNHMITTAPDALIQSAIHAARNIGETTAPATKGALAVSTATSAKVGVLAAVGAIAVIGGVAALLQLGRSTATTGQTVAATPATQPQSPQTQPTAEDWRVHFNQVYSLAPGQRIKLIPPPFIPERDFFWVEDDPARAASNPNGPDVYVFRSTGQPESSPQRGWGMSGARSSLPTALWLLLQVGFQELEMPPEYEKIILTGDWVIRADLTKQEIVDEVCALIRQQGGPSIRFQLEERHRRVIVAQGGYNYQPAPGTKSGPVALFVDQPDPLDDPGLQETGMQFQTFIDTIGRHLGMRVENKSAARAQRIYTVIRHSSFKALEAAPDPLPDETITKVLGVVASQTGLEFVIEPRTERVWVAHPDPK